MAEITFMSERATERFEKCKKFTESKGDKSLERCLDVLRSWTNPVSIGCDFDEMSFSFQEELPQELRDKGYRGVNGGILYHGPRDSFGSGDGPVFAVTIGRTEGYSIHT